MGWLMVNGYLKTHSIQSGIKINIHIIQLRPTVSTDRKQKSTSCFPIIKTYSSISSPQCAAHNPSRIPTHVCDGRKYATGSALETGFEPDQAMPRAIRMVWVGLSCPLHPTFWWAKGDVERIWVGIQGLFWHHFFGKSKLSSGVSFHLTRWYTIKSAERVKPKWPQLRCLVWFFGRYLHSSATLGCSTVDGRNPAAVEGGTVYLNSKYYYFTFLLYNRSLVHWIPFSTWPSWNTFARWVIALWPRTRFWTAPCEMISPATPVICRPYAQFSMGFTGMIRLNC